MITKICTSIEQSKKFIEWGIDINTADMCYHFIEINKTPLCVRWEKVHDDEKDNSLPAWSLAALLGVLPSVIKRKNKRMFLTLEKAGAYNLYYKSPDRLDELWETKEEPIDACVAMIELLHEQNII